MDYDQPIFVVGIKYRALRDFSSGPTSHFIKGEILLFDRDTYSRYDDCFVYMFHNENTGESKGWWLFDGESIDSWKDFFEPVVTNSVPD